MSTDKVILSDNDLDDITGGMISFNRSGTKIKYTSVDGTQDSFVVNDFENAFKLTKQLRTELVPEDQIIQKLKESGAII